MATRRMVALLLCLATTLCVVRAQRRGEMIDSLSAIHNFGTIAEERAGRPGQFVKTISVYSNGKDGSYILRIKGIVE